MVKTKGGRLMNPTDSFRKEQRKKEIQRNKMERKYMRDAHSKKTNPEEIKGQLQELLDLEEQLVNGGKALPKMQRLRKKVLQEAYDAALKRKKEEEAKAKHAIHGSRPEDSRFYHPVKNPTGAPPPGVVPAALVAPTGTIPVPKPPPLPPGPKPNLPPPPAAPPVPSGPAPTMSAAGGPLPPPAGPPPALTPLPPPSGPPPTMMPPNRAPGDDEGPPGVGPGPLSSAPHMATRVLPPPPGPPPGMAPGHHPHIMGPPSGALPPPPGPPPAHALLGPPSGAPAMAQTVLPPPLGPPPAMMMMPPGNHMAPPLMPPPAGPPPSLAGKKETKTTITGASTVVKRPLAQHDRTVTAMVPASVRVRREASETRAKGAQKDTGAGSGYGLAPVQKPLAYPPVSGENKAVGSMDSKYMDFLDSMRELGAV